MIAILKKILLENKVIKIISCITGYTLWSFLGQTFIISQWIEVPICFYNVPENITVSTQPEKLCINIQGKKSDIACCKEIAFHIDAHNFSNKDYIVEPKPEQLFLPVPVRMIQYKPQKIHVIAKNN